MRYCILSIFHVINVFMNSSLHSCETYRQVEEMDKLNFENTKGE